MRGILRCPPTGGRGCALSHRSAAELWALLAPRTGLIHVTVPSYAGRARRDGLEIHRSTSVDFLWRSERLIVETDAWTTHRCAQAFEDDHQRDLELAELGYRVRRFTWAQIRDQPAKIAAALRAELGLSSSAR